MADVSVDPHPLASLAADHGQPQRPRRRSHANVTPRRHSKLQEQAVVVGSHGPPHTRYSSTLQPPLLQQTCERF
jgi:hypothetical protein